MTRRTKIVCTMGPAISDDTSIKSLVGDGSLEPNPAGDIHLEWQAAGQSVGVRHSPARSQHRQRLISMPASIGNAAPVM